MARRSVTDKNKGKLNFYAEVLDKAERIEFEEAAAVEGLDEEIALIRLKLRQLLEEQPENFRLQMRAISTLDRLIRAKYDISRKQKNREEAFATALKDAALKLGLEFRP